MVDISAVFANFVGSFPNFAGKNATGAGATDGTEFIAAMIDNWMWGWQQALFDQEGITPDGVTEAAGASQILDALNNMIPPGVVLEWNINVDPATLGARFLLLNGQGILRANYAALDANVYVGDANNAAVAAGGGAYYRADDAAGTIPNIAGVYLILPESRGYAPRGLDLAAAVDPLGASRFLGDNQGSAMWGHHHSGTVTLSDLTTGTGQARNVGVGNNAVSGVSVTGAITDGVNGTPTLSSESRMVNRSTQFAIRY